MRFVKKESLNREWFETGEWKWLDPDEAKTNGEMDSVKPEAIYFFSLDGNHSFCRRYNREVDFKQDVEALELCRKCGMRFWTYRAAQICVFVPTRAYSTLESPHEAVKLDAFPDTKDAERGVADFERKKWE